MFNTYLFDLDGTLIDSLGDLADACNFVLAEAGLPPHPAASYRHFVGNGAYKLAERMLPEQMRDTDTIARFKAAFDRRYNDHAFDKTRPYPGIPETIAALRARGAKLAVLSNKPDPFVRRLCDGLFPAGTFDAVCGQRDGAAAKPAPDGVFAILEELSADQEHALFIGDSDVDIRTAQNAGIRSAGAVWGFRGREELVRAGADFLLDSAEDLLAL